QNGRCAEAVSEEERALDALPDRTSPEVAATLRERLGRIVASCGKGAAAASTRSVEGEPILKICRQPLLEGFTGVYRASARFTIREDGTVTAVAIGGASNGEHAGVLKQFVE